MADALVKLPDDAANTGPQIDNTSLTVSAQTVLRQRVQVAGDDALELAVVTNTTPGAGDYALVVRTVGSSAVTIASLPLPSGAATETTLAAIAAALAGTLAVTGTVAVSSSALPTGAATQTTLAAILAAVTGTLGISGTVGISGALPAGNNNIGDVDVASLPALPAGSNNIGDVDVLSLPALPAGSNNIGDVDVLTMPALVNTGQSVTASLDGAAVMVAGAALVPKFASFNLTADGDILASVSGKKIRVLAMFCSSDLDGTFRLRRTNSGTNWLTGILQVRVGGGFVLPFNPVGWFETAATESLNADLTTLTNLGGAIVYLEV